MTCRSTQVHKIDGRMTSVLLLNLAVAVILGRKSSSAQTAHIWAALCARQGFLHARAVTVGSSSCQSVTVNHLVQAGSKRGIGAGWGAGGLRHSGARGHQRPHVPGRAGGTAGADEASGGCRAAHHDVAQPQGHAAAPPGTRHAVGRG